LKLNAAALLWELAGETNNIAEIALSVMDDNDPNTRRRAAKFLSGFCSTNKICLPEFQNLLHSKDLSTRVYIATIFSNVRGESEVALPILVEGLKDRFTYYDNADIRRISAVTLGNMGRQAIPAFEALRETLNDPDETVRIAGRTSLRQIRADAEKN
jgi:HEAT repeat protein